MNAAMDRTHTVLQAMHDQGYISDAQMLAALSAPPPQIPPSDITEGARYVADWITGQAEGALGHPIDRDITIATSIDPKLQRLAEAKVEAALNGPAQKVRASQAALVAMTPDGRVRAMVGGRDYEESQFNRATQALRQPGSAFKPFVYLAALESGLKPDSLVDDGPVEIGGWSPSNYEPGFKGRIPAREALAESVNTAAVRVLDFAGIDHTRKVAQRLGIGEPIPRDLSIALGTCDVTLIEMTGAYAAFANGGTGVLPHAVEKISDSGGNVLYARQGSGPGEAALPWLVAELDSMMMDVVAYGTGKAARLDRPVAGKTGTTNDYRNAWFIGFTSDLVTGVWFGNDDNSPMKHVTGGMLPARTWHDFMMEAEAGRPIRDLAPLAHLPQPEAPAPQAEAASLSAGHQPSGQAPDSGGVLGAFERVLRSVTGG
jgi:penicillin-binding protein 1A